MNRKAFLTIAGAGGVLLIATGAMILSSGGYSLVALLDIVGGIGLILTMTHGALEKKGVGQ